MLEDVAKDDVVETCVDLADERLAASQYMTHWSERIRARFEERREFFGGAIIGVFTISSRRIDGLKVAGAQLKASVSIESGDIFEQTLPPPAVVFALRHELS